DVEVSRDLDVAGDVPGGGQFAVVADLERGDAVADTVGDVHELPVRREDALCRRVVLHRLLERRERLDYRALAACQVKLDDVHGRVEFPADVGELAVRGDGDVPRARTGRRADGADCIGLPGHRVEPEDHHE